MCVHNVPVHVCSLTISGGGNGGKRPPFLTLLLLLLSVTRTPSPQDSGLVALLHLSSVITLKIARDEKKKRKKRGVGVGAMERTCIFVISDCLPFSRQIDFYISCYWKLSGLDCQACLALASAAKPVSELYDLALGRTFKAFNSQVISVIQYCFCPDHLCCFLSLSAASHSFFSFLHFFILQSKTPFHCLSVSHKGLGLTSCPFLYVYRKGGLLVAPRRSDYRTLQKRRRRGNARCNPPADIYVLLWGEPG